MRLLTCIAILVALFAGPRPATADERADEYKRLVGKWRATKGTWAGTALTAEQAKQCTLDFHPPRSPNDLSGFGPRGMDLRVPDKLVGFEVVGKDDKPETRYVTEWEGYSPALDTKATPRTLFASRTFGIKGHGFGGIYRVEGDKLTVCLDLNAFAKPPKAFESPARSRVLLLTLERVKSK